MPPRPSHLKRVAPPPQGNAAPISRERRRQGFALGGAVLLHSGLLVWLCLIPAPKQSPLELAQSVPSVNRPQPPAEAALAGELEVWLEAPLQHESSGSFPHAIDSKEQLAAATLPESRTPEGVAKAARLDPTQPDPDQADPGTSRETADGEPADALSVPAAKPQSPSAPRLSLSDLGVGNSRAHWRPASKHRGASAAARKRVRAQQLEARIEREMAQGALERDVRLGLGPGGEVLSALERDTRTSSAPVRGYAIFQLTTDSQGRITQMQVIEAGGGAAEWQAVGNRVRRSLSAARLKVGGRATRLLLRVESTVSLPSGADPGLGIDMFGVPLQKGEGKKSARVSLFTPPEFVEVEVPDPGNPKRTVRIPMFVPPSLISGGGDLSDVGAKPRRVVYARVVKAQALP